MCEATVRKLSPWSEVGTTVAATGFDNVALPTVCTLLSIDTEAGPRGLAMGDKFSTFDLVRKFEIDLSSMKN